MSNEFDQKVALVTGGTRGIGREVVLDLARHGCRVAFNYRSSEEAASALAEEVTALGSEARYFQVNVADGEAVREMVEEVVKDFGQIHFLVNNAGITRDNLLVRMKEEEWDEVIDVNLTGVYHLCRHVVAKMIRKKSGRIVNVGSVSGVLGQKGQVNYSAAKAGLIGLTKALAREVASRRINVNCLAFGFVETEMAGALGEEALAEALKEVPLGRMATSEEAAAWIRYLLSDAASYMTGQVVCVDGGMAI